MCARLCSCLCFLKQRSWGQGACPDSSLSALLQVRTSARGRSTACGPPTSAHGKPGWTLCHTLTKVTFIFRLLKGHSMTPGAGEEEEGEGSFLPFSFFFLICCHCLKKICLVFSLVLPPLSTCTGTFSSQMLQHKLSLYRFRWLVTGFSPLSPLRSLCRAVAVVPQGMSKHFQPCCALQV